MKEDKVERCIKTIKESWPALVRLVVEHIYHSDLVDGVMDHIINDYKVEFNGPYLSEVGDKAALFEFTVTVSRYSHYTLNSYFSMKDLKELEPWQIIPENFNISDCGTGESFRFEVKPLNELVLNSI